MKKEVFLTSLVVCLAFLLSQATNSPAQTYVLVGNETQLTTDAADQFDPKISGDLVVYTDYRNGHFDIYCYDLSTGLEAPITSAEGDQQFADILDGRIVYTDFSAGQGDLYLYDMATNQTTRLTDHPSNQLKSAIFDDIVVFEDDRNGSLDVYMIDLNNMTETRLTHDDNVQWRPIVHNNIIAWEDHRNGNPDIYMFDLNSNGETQIASRSCQEMNPDIWQNRIVFVSECTGLGDIYMYGIATGETSKIAGSDDHTEFRPKISGDIVAFERWFDDDPDGLVLYSINLGVSAEVPNGGGDQYLHDLSGNRLVYTDKRNGNLDIYLYEFWFKKAADIKISPLGLDFCEVELGETGTASLTITNVGEVGLTITDVNLVGKDFSLLLFPAPSEQIPPNSSREISIAFTPSLVGNATATLEINSNDPDEPQVQVPITGTGVEVEPLLCSEPLASHIYNGCTIPEDDPAGAWQIWEEYTYNSAWESEGGNLHLDACEQHGRAGFYRAEASLATAKKFAIEARAWLTCHVTPTLIELIYLGFTARDGVKAATLWTTGAPEEGQVALNWIDSTPYLSAKHVTDWYSPNIYRLVVDKTAANPAEHSAKVYVNGALVLTVPYDNLTDTPGGISDPPGVSHFFAFGGDQSDVVWDYVRYEECAQIPPEEQFEALIDEIEELLDSGEINEQDAKRLIAKLEDAVRKLSEGDVDTAIDQLNAFINKVQSLINSGQIDEEIGQQLIAAAQALIDELNGLAKAAHAGEKADEPVPTAFSLEQNYPNPFLSGAKSRLTGTPSTEIRFQLPHASHVSLAVFNALGQRIRTLVDQNYQPGSHSVRWDGRDANGTSVGSGVYFYQLQAGSTLLVKKMSLIY